MKALLKLLGTLAAIAVFGVAGLVGYGIHANQRAADDAANFCGEVAIGADPTPALARAEAAGIRHIAHREPHGHDFYFPGWVFNAAVCQLSLVDGRVSAIATRSEGD